MLQHERNRRHYAYLEASEDWIRYVLDQPMRAEPGEEVPGRRVAQNEIRRAVGQEQGGWRSHVREPSAGSRSDGQRGEEGDAAHEGETVERAEQQLGGGEIVMAMSIHGRVSWDAGACS